jgi:opacity protein-like surface antigen
MLLLVVAVAASGQNVPKAEVAAGYSYSRAGAGGLSGINLNGWSGTLTGNFNSWFGVTADFAGHYGSVSGTGVNRHSFLFGPKLTYRGGEGKVNPFAHALFGGVRAHREATPPVPVVAAASETAFGMVLGGGVDYAMNDRFAIRVFQADYLLTRFQESSGIVCIQSVTFPCTIGQAGTQHSARLSFGVVWRFGKR